MDHLPDAYRTKLNVFHQEMKCSSEKEPIITQDSAWGDAQVKTSTSLNLYGYNKDSSSLYTHGSADDDDACDIAGFSQFHNNNNKLLTQNSGWCNGHRPQADIFRQSIKSGNAM
eukprot:jgi/Psemu1/49670/gm1.49670_g